MGRASARPFQTAKLKNHIMKNILSISAVLLTALVLQAAPGELLTKSATGTTSAQVIFPARGGVPRVVAYDVTADNATNRLYFYAAVSNINLRAVTTATSTTNAVFDFTTVSNADVVLFQNESGVLTNKTVYSRTYATNYSVALMAPLGTNLAIGDTFKERLTTVYHPLGTNALTAKSYFLDATNYLAANDVIVLDRGGGNALLTGTISALGDTTNAFASFTAPLLADVPPGSTVYRRLYSTNIPVKLNVAASTSHLICATNGMAAGTNLLIVAKGARQLIDITSIQNTNITLNGTLDFAITTNDSVYILGNSTATITPANASDGALLLASTNGFVAGSDLVIGTALQRQTIGSIYRTNLHSITLSAAFGPLLQRPNVINKLTNTFTVKLAADASAAAVIADATTGLTVGDPIIVLPASGGVFANRIAPGTSTDITATLNFTSAIGITLGAGSKAWLEGAPANTLVGSATLRRDSAAIYAGRPNSPIRAYLTGASACSINSATVRY